MSLPYGKIAEERKILSDVIAAVSNDAEEMGLNLHYVTAAVEAADVVVEPMGYPIIWSAAADNFVPFIAQDITAADALGGLPASGRVALAVGDERGAGFNTVDVTLVAAGTKVTALYSGLVGIKASGIDFNAGTNAGVQALFLSQLETQGLFIAPESANVTVQYI